jgi:hypothetical protein
MATTTTAGSPLSEELQIEYGHFVNIALSDDKQPTQRDIPPFRLIMMEPGDSPEPYGACGVRLDRVVHTAEPIHAALQHPTAA